MLNSELKDVKTIAEELSVTVQTVYRHLDKIGRDDYTVKDNSGKTLITMQGQGLLKQSINPNSKPSADKIEPFLYAPENSETVDLEPEERNPNNITQDYIETLKQQLEAKDKQINELNERLQETNIILAQEKQEKQLLLEAKHVDDLEQENEVAEADDLTPNKRTLAQRFRDFFK